MNIRCKFQVSSVEKTDQDQGRRLNMVACVSDAGDNKNWYKWTPSGSFSINVMNESVFPTLDAMKYGDVYFLALEECSKVDAPKSVAEAVRRGFEDK